MVAKYARVLSNSIYPRELITVGTVYRIQAFFEDGVTLISERGLPIYFFYDELRLIGHPAQLIKTQTKKEI